MLCQVEETRDRLAARVPTLVALEGCRFIIVRLDAIATYKIVVAWFPGPVEDTERHFQLLRRLNLGLDTRQ